MPKIAKVKNPYYFRDEIIAQDSSSGEPIITRISFFSQLRNTADRYEFADGVHQLWWKDTDITMTFVDFPIQDDDFAPECKLVTSINGKTLYER